MATNSASGHSCTLCPEGQLECVWKLIEVLYPPFEQSFVAIFEQFFLFCPRPGRLATVPWAVNFLTMLRTVDTGTLGSLEMDFLPWDCPCFSTFFDLKSSRQFFSALSRLHSSFGTQRQTERLSEIFTILTGSGVISILSARVTGYRWLWLQIIGASQTWNAIISYNFEKVPIILSSPFWSFAWNVSDLAFCFSTFLCHTNANKRNTHENA